jgi:hypothetical protein
LIPHTEEEHRLWVSENRALKKILGYNRKNTTAG